MRAVLDTNIFISGIFWKGIPNRIINAWKKREFDLVTSLENVSELIKVLKDFKINMDEELIYEWVTLIIKNSIIADVKNEIKVVKDDPSDNKFIETAINGKADYIVTQDRHLLDIGKFENIKIITPNEFLTAIKKLY